MKKEYTFNLRDLQKIAAKLKLYHKAIDGIDGPATQDSVYKLLLEHPYSGWSQQRKMVGALQAGLKKLGYDPGRVDGYYGDLTNEALNSWLYKNTYGKKEKIATEIYVHTVDPKFPPQSRVNSYYGVPGTEIQRNLIYIDLPYTMVLDWDTNQKVGRIRLHKKCATSAKAVLEEVLNYYGLEAIERLGLNRFAGSYNHRKMRGGNKWSMHAYGCAIDFYAAPNGLRTKCPEALFCGQDYIPFFDIWEKYGWTSLGRAIGRDWMHVQAASL